MVVPPNEFQEQELFVSRGILERLGATVHIASTKTGQLIGQQQRKATATVLIDSVSANEYNAVLLIGGLGAEKILWFHKHLHALIQQAHALGLVIGAICLAPVILACAGLLTGKEAAVFRSASALGMFQKLGVRVAEQDVVCMENIITANGPHVADAWARQIASWLNTSRNALGVHANETRAF